MSDEVVAGRYVASLTASTVSRGNLVTIWWFALPQAKSQLATVQKTNEASESLARVNFAPACEAALNEQCNVEYNVSYIYHAMYNYFNRDNVALPGFAKFFKESSKEERDHAELVSPGA